MASAYLAQFLAGKPSFGEEFIGGIEARDKARREQELQAAAAATKRMIAERMNRRVEDQRTSVVLGGLGDLDPQTKATYEAQIRANPSAVASKGKLFGSYDEASNAHRAGKQAQAKEQVERANRLKLEANSKAYNSKIAELKKSLEATPEEVAKLEGLDPSSITPEALNVARGKIRERMSELEREFMLAKNAPEDATGSRKANLAAIRARAEALKKIHDNAGQALSISSSNKEYQRGLDDEAKQLLEELLVMDPMEPEADQRRVIDRAREQALEEMSPDLVELASVDPAGAKLFTEMIKQNAKQGDAGIEREAKDDQKQKQFDFQAINNYRRAQGSVEQAAERLALAREDLARKKAKDKNDASYQRGKLALGDAEQQMRLEIAYLNAAVSELNNVRGNDARIRAAALQREAAFTEQMMKQYQDAIALGNDDAALEAVSRMRGRRNVFTGGVVGASKSPRLVKDVKENTFSANDVSYEVQPGESIDLSMFEDGQSAPVAKPARSVSAAMNPKKPKITGPKKTAPADGPFKR